MEAYETAKELYGGENSADAADLLSFMAIVKARLCQFEESFNLLKKAKEIEEKVSSFHSQRYKAILTLEANIKDFEAKNTQNAKKVDRKDKTSILKKLAPNTPIKVGIYTTVFIATIGTLVYWWKSKKD